MSPTRIEEENNKEETTKPLVIDSWASATYVPFAQKIGLQYYRRNQGSSEVWIAEFKTKLVGLISARALVQQSRPTRTQTYARTTGHVHSEQPSSTQIRLSAARNSIWTVDISSNYLYVPFSCNFCHIHGNNGTSQHHTNQYQNEDARCSPRW